MIKFKPIKIPSSFVAHNMKIANDSGSGESKLWVGSTQAENDIDSFFSFGDGYKYIISKENLRDYLLQVKIEYIYQIFNKYKNASLNTWIDNYNEVEKLPTPIIEFNLVKFTDKSRYYVRSEDSIFKKILRSLILPKITDLVFIKDTDNKTISISLEINQELNPNNKEDNSPSETKSDIQYCLHINSDFPYNRIIFGAPGTGKSFKINEDRKKLLGLRADDDYERVTFHPDYSYANFVGTYKPVMKQNNNQSNLDPDTNFIFSVLDDKTLTDQQKYDQLYGTFNNNQQLTNLPILMGLICGTEKINTRLADGSASADNNQPEFNKGKSLRKFVKPANMHESNSSGGISYEYVPGPFMRLYVEAMKNVLKVAKGEEEPRPFLLIIEEINRANVAAVFGEIFQLLDRNEDNVSEYPIQTSEDIRNYLAKELGGNPSDYAQIRIPDNMFIWATMNSADQGVFPMDTAFKRRWDFTYLGIDDNDSDIQGKVVKIKVGNTEKDIEWNSLRQAINEFLAKEKINEDKQLGPYFISRKITVPANGGNIIDTEAFNRVFKQKVIPYLFDDAAKQKRSKLFEGIPNEANRYSKICEEYNKIGIGIFAQSIQNYACEKSENNATTTASNGPDELIPQSSPQITIQN